MTINLQDVRVIPLKKVLNERGHLMEVQRNDDNHFPGFGQLYITSTKPGEIKGWYRHVKQTDQIGLIQGAALLVLYDTRETSSTNGKLQQIHLTEIEPMLVQIPPGIWHGFLANSAEPTLLLHLNTIPWDSMSPDEERMPPDDPRISFAWPR